MSIKLQGLNFATRSHSGGNGFLLSNTGQKVTETFELVLEYDFESTMSEQVLIVSETKLRILGGSWSEKGYVVGDNVLLYGEIVNGGSVVTYSGLSRNITAITGDTMTLDATLDPAASGAVVGQVMPSPSGSGGNTTLGVANDTRSTAESIKLLHNLTPNSGSGSAASLFDGELNAFEVEGVAALAVSASLSMTQLGNKSGGSYDSATLERLADVAATDWTKTTRANKRYQITLVYANPLKFEDADFLKPSWFDTNNTVKTYYEITAQSEENNPNAALTTAQAPLLGNMGWRDESYNQGPDEFTVESVLIEDTSGNALAAVDFAQDCVITATLSHPSLDFLEAAEVEFFLIPDLTLIKNKLDRNADLIQLSNFYINAVPTVTESVYGTGGAEMQTSAQSLDVSTPGQLVVQFTLEPNAAFTALVDSFAELSRRFVITATVESTGGDANENNAVTKTLASGLLERAPVVGEPYPFNSQTFFNHANDLTGASEPEYRGCTEDDFLYRALFNLELGAVWSGLNLKVQVVRDSDGGVFDLLTEFVNFENYLVNTAGAIQINYVKNTPQFLESPDRNQLSVSLTGNDSGSDYEVQVLWSLMASWRYWIAQSNAFADFIDGALPNDGLSNEWMRYLREAGYSLRVRAELIDGNNTAYYFGAGIDLQDYDAAEPGLTTTLEYYDSAGNAQTGLIDGDIMTVKAVHTLASGSWSTSDVWGWVSLRPSESDPNKRISTEWDWTAENYPLMPPAGETKATLTFPSAGVAEVECRINTTLVNTESSTVVARIESPKDPACIGPIDYLFKAVVTSSESEADYANALDRLLKNGISADGVCCPTCEVILNDGSTVGLFVFAPNVLINTVIADMAGGADDLCCRDTYGGTATCNADFDAEWDALMLELTGDTALLTSTVPGQINTYAGAGLSTISSSVQLLTADESVRYAVMLVIMSRGIKVVCGESGKFISAI